MFRLGDWDFGLQFPGEGDEVRVFNCWHPGEMVFDPNLQKIVEADDNNPMHRLHLDGQSASGTV
jgi:hypothetical protein